MHEELQMQSTGRAAVQVRLSSRELYWLENWRRAQEKIPARSEAIREAIRRLVRPADEPGRSESRSMRCHLNQKNTVRRQAGPYVNPADAIGETVGSKDAVSAT